MRVKIKNKLTPMALLFWVVFGGHLWGQQAERASPEKLCRAYWSLISEVPIIQGAVVVERTNHSADADFAKSSASLIQNTIGGKITFTEFHHLPFEITAADLKVNANLLVFGFEKESDLKKYLEKRPAGIVGKRGILTAKAPQQFKVLTMGACLIVMIVDGARVDEIGEELFERAGRLLEPSGK